MKKILKALGIISLTIIIIFMLGSLIIWKMLLPPSVRKIEKKNVTSYVEDYLTKNMVNIVLKL